MILNVVEKSESSYQIRCRCWCAGFLIANHEWIIGKYISIEPATLQCSKSLIARFIEEQNQSRYFSEERKVITRLVAEGILKLDYHGKEN